MAAGADLGWLSQYPHEREILFAPLTGLEVQWTRVQDSVLVVGVSLSINLASLTIEQVVGKRKKLVSDAAEGAILETRGEALALGLAERAEAVAETVRSPRRLCPPQPSPLADSPISVWLIVDS